jgi:hypothetical protein
MAQGISKRLSAAVLALFIASCGDDRFSGEVVGKYHRDAYTSYVWISHGRNGGGHMVPVHHPEKWCLIVRRESGGEVVERLLDVNKSVFENPPLGDHYPPGSLDTQ